uniref:Glycine-rich protein n=4 Tax=IRL clade TaxID=2233839 RepID=A0A411AFF1_GLYUR|nr:glycine-rich protein [Glycyrrhiza uralensis]
MKIKTFILYLFCTLLLISAVKTETTEDGYATPKEESKTNVELDGFAHWKGGGAIWQTPSTGGNNVVPLFG